MHHGMDHGFMVVGSVATTRVQFGKAVVTANLLVAITVFVLASR